MSALTQFRDYCREMAAADHTRECRTRLAEWERAAMDHHLIDPGPRPECDGCVSDSDRRLWTCLAREIDDYLADDEPRLFA